MMPARYLLYGLQWLDGILVKVYCVVAKKIVMFASEVTSLHSEPVAVILHLLLLLESFFKF